MSHRVVLSARAERDRDAAYAWYAENYSVEFASRWYNGIMQAMYSLAEQPRRCAVAHENDRFSFELRELLYGPRLHKHRLLFTIEGERVAILHIRHSSQRDLTADDL